MIKPLATLPNQDGFTFIGVLRDGRMVQCHIVKDVTTGLHCIAGARYSDLKGWQ